MPGRRLSQAVPSTQILAFLPRSVVRSEGNNWSYHYCRRQWSLVDNGTLRYKVGGRSTRRAASCAFEAGGEGMPELRLLAGVLKCCWKASRALSFEAAEG